MLYLIASAALGGCVFFLVRWVQMRGAYQTLSRAEQRRVEMLASREQSEKVSVSVKIRKEMVRLGLGDDPFPLYAAAGVVYLAVATAMTMLSIPTWVGLLVAVPGSVAGGWFTVLWRARKRRAEFNQQLIDLLDQLINQIEGGTGAARALAIIAPQMPDPLRGELLLTLAAGEVSGDIVEALGVLREKYPSRPMDMFITALEIDRAEGQAIAPALEQASTMLKNTFALSAETDSELSSVKYEFYGVTLIIIGVGLSLIFGGDETAKAAYYSFAGIVVVLAAIGNMALGMWRFAHKIVKVKGDT